MFIGFAQKRNENEKKIYCYFPHKNWEKIEL